MSNETIINLGFANRWSPFRQLHQMVSTAVTERSSQRSLPDLEALLIRHKTDFISLLKNPTRNALHKEIVLNASKEGIVVIQQQNRVKTIIPQQMVDEALLMSEMFDLNELSALELIIAGENQESRYAGLSRGPIAVLLYLDGRKSLLSALHSLVQASTGRTWSLKVSRDLSRLINKFTEELKDEGIITQCIEQLSALDIKAEFDLLERNRAMGSFKYRKQVLDLLKQIRQLLADIIFCYSSQTDLNPNEVLKLIQIISKTSKPESSHSLDSVSTTLLMSFLYVIDVSFVQNTEENDKRISTNSLLKYPNLINELEKHLNQNQFCVEGIKTILQFGLAVSSKTLSIYPIQGIDCEVEDEKLMDSAIEEKVFESMNALIGLNELISSEEFYIRRIHNLITDFIALTPIKIKELKDKADEIGRIINAYSAEGIQPPTTLPRHFEKLLYFMAELYSRDTFKLSNEFWPLLYEGKQSTPRHQALHKFIRTIQDSFFPPVLHIPVIKLLKSLAMSSAFNVFNLIKSPTLHLSSQFSMDYFNSTLIQYYNAVRGSDNKANNSASTYPFGLANVQMHGQNRIITSIESEIVCAIIELIEVIVTKDRTCCLAIAENHQYSVITSLIGVLRCAVPKELKAAILNCLSGFASSSSSVAFMIWSKIDGILPKFMPTVTSGVAPMAQHRMWQNGIGIEIEEIEAKNEEYPITIGFVRLMKALFTHCDSSQPQTQQSSAEVCLNFVINSILLKTNARVFKIEDQKWIINRICYEILVTVIEKYEPSVEGHNSKAAFNIFAQILQESGLFRQIMYTIEDIADTFEKQMLDISFQSDQTFSKLTEDCALNALKIIECICEKQNDFIDMVHQIPGFPLAIIAKFDVLFNNVNPRTGTIDRLSTLVRLIYLPTQASIETLKVLNTLCKSNLEVSHLCLSQLQSSNSKVLSNDYIINSFVECLESESKELRLETLNLIDTCLDFVNANYSYNFAHKLLGIDKTRAALKDAGNLGQSFTCFHSILSFFDSTVDIKEFLEERRLGMKILYKLCVSLYTYETVLRFLRTSYDFIVQYLHSWDKMRLDSSLEPELHENLLQEMTFFLQILAIDIKITCEQNLKSQCAAYINFLFVETKRGRILELLSPTVFLHSHPVLPNFEFFESKELWKAMSECSNPNKSIDLKALHQRLVNEIRIAGPQLGVIQTNLVRNELKTVLSFGAALNESQLKLNIKTKYFDSWRELLEILIITRSLDSCDEDSRVRYLMEIIVELINRASDSSTSASLFSPISSAVLMVSSALYGIKSLTMTSNVTTCVKAIMNILDSASSAVWTDQKIIRINFYASLLYLFQSLPSNLFNEFKYNNRLLDRMAKDMLSGHEVAKVLAISLLNRSDLSMWLTELSSNGTLRQLLDTLLTDDREIRANNFEFIKTFYGFEAKMMLLLQIFSSSKGSHLPIHNLDLVTTLESIQSFDMYPYLVGQNTVCHKIFVDILRLILTISTTNNQQIINELSEFINSRTTLSDILRMAPNIKSGVEGKEAIVLITKLMSRLIGKVNKTTEISFIGLLSHFCNDLSTPEDLQIVFNILFGCIQYSRTNALLPLFEPTLATQDSKLITHQPLGLLVSIINNCSTKSSESLNVLPIVESALYLLWHHLNLFFSVLNIPDDRAQEVENMKTQSEYILSDAFFSKIQVISHKNTFVDALVRRIKRIIHLKKNS